MGMEIPAFTFKTYLLDQSDVRAKPLKIEICELHAIEGDLATARIVPPFK